jgi:transketolase
MKMENLFTGSSALAQAARYDILRMTHSAKASHVGSGLSCIDILSVLYHSIANIDPEDPTYPDRDRIIISKGHAAAAVYAVLANKGFFSKTELAEYCKNGSRLIGHVTTTVPGVEFSTGSLGHGLPFSVGLALAGQRDHSTRRIFTLLSDGELDEGSNWESALIANHYDLKNLTVIIDRNRLQSLTTTEETIALEPLAAKWEAFGWDVLSVDGHNHEALSESLTTKQQKPTCIIAETTKGKGVPFMENKVLWHYRSPNDDDLAAAFSALKQGGPK